MAENIEASEVRRINLSGRDIVSMADSIDVSDADEETKADIETIAREYEKSFRKRCERILRERE